MQTNRDKHHFRAGRPAHRKANGTKVTVLVEETGTHQDGRGMPRERIARMVRREVRRVLGDETAAPRPRAMMVGPDSQRRIVRQGGMGEGPAFTCALRPRRDAPTDERDHIARLVRREVRRALRETTA